MQYKITTDVELLNLDGKLVVTKSMNYTQDDGRPLYLHKKEGSVRLFDNDLIQSNFTQNNSEKHIEYKVSDCNKFLILLDSFVNNKLDKVMTFELEGFMRVSGGKTNGTESLLIKIGHCDLYMTLFEVRCAERCIKNVLSFLAKE